MSRDATFRFFFCTSSFVGGKGTDFNDTIVFKASGGQTLTMVYIYYGTLAGHGMRASIQTHRDNMMGDSPMSALGHVLVM